MHLDNEVSSERPLHRALDSGNLENAIQLLEDGFPDSLLDDTEGGSPWLELIESYQAKHQQHWARKGPALDQFPLWYGSATYPPHHVLHAPLINIRTEWD